MSHLNQKRNLYEVTLLAVLMLLALAIRAWRFDAAFWYDEVFSTKLAGLPLDKLIIAAAADVHPPTYYLLLSAVNRLFGESEITMRLPSLIAGIAMIPAIFALGKSIKLPGPAYWLATALVTFSPFMVYYSQEARSYAILMLLITLAALGAARGKAWLVIIACTAALYLHNMAAPFVGAMLLGTLLLNFDDLLRPVKWGAIIALLFLPGLVIMAYQVQAVGQSFWVPAFSSPGRLLSVLDDLIFFTPQTVFVIPSAICTALGLLLIFISLRQLRPPAPPPSVLFLAIAALLPLVVVFVVSVLWRPIIVTRAMSPAAPAYYLLLAWAVTQSRRRAAIWGVIAVPVIALTLIGPALGDMGRKPTDWAYLNLYGELQPGDGVFHANMGSYMTWWYYRPDVPQYVLRQDGNLSENLTDPTKRAMGIREAKFEEVACSGPRRWWLIYYINPTTKTDEISYVRHLEQAYKGHKIALLRDDVTVEAWIVRLQPNSNCWEAELHRWKRY